MTKESLHTLTYVSTAIKLFDNEALIELLHYSRAHNKKHGITGLLLYHEGTFMQTLEGSPDAVRQLYTNICADERHYGAIKLVYEPIDERVFPDWSMGFKNGPKATEGFSNYLTNNDGSKKDSDRNEKALSHGELLLSSFKSHVRTG